MRNQPGSFGWKFTFFCLGREVHLNLLLVLVLIAMEYALLQLGFWQLDRARQKEDLQTQLAEQKSQPPIDISKGTVSVVDYQNIAFKGRPVGRLTVLVANQSHQGQDGYHVLNLVELEKQQAVWVNRGWIKALPDRRFYPEVAPLPEHWSATGVVYFDKGEPLLFEHALQQVSSDLWLMQGLSFRLLSQINETRNLTILPFIIRLAPEASHGFVRDWHWISMTPEKHFAYAVQWFGLALALLLMSVFISIKKQRPNK